MRPMINSRKHIVQVTLSTAGFGLVATNNIVVVNQNPDQSLAVDVAPGTVVKAVYAEIWLLAASAQPTTITAIIYKQPSELGSISAAEMTDLHTYKNKNNIFEIHQGIVPDANANPVPVFRGWIKIPKGKQRMSIGDRITFSMKGITEDTEYCGFFVFKSYN